MNNPISLPADRLIVLDIMRIVAMSAVVLIHTTTKTLEVTGYDVQRTPWTLFLNLIARFAVPLFFLLSGFVLEYRYADKLPIASFFKKRTLRILVPYLLWSIFYTGIHVFINHESMTSGKILFNILTGNAEFQLYFIPTLILFYLLFPLLHAYRRILIRPLTIFSIGIVEISLSVSDFYFKELHILYPLKVFFLTFVFFVIGMWASHHRERLTQYFQKRIMLMVLFLFATWSSLFFETWRMFVPTQYLPYVTSQWRPTVYLYTLIVVALLIGIFSRQKKFLTQIHMLSRLSFFVFFVHIASIFVIWRYIGSRLFYITSGHMADMPLYDVGIYILVLFSSYVLAWLISKIPKVSWLLGI